MIPSTVHVKDVPESMVFIGHDMYGTIHHKTVEGLNGGPMRLAMAACITVNLNELYNIARSMSQTIVQKELVSLYTFSTFQSSQVI